MECSEGRSRLTEGGRKEERRRKKVKEKELEKEKETERKDRMKGGRQG
jgi:hypothetical protein